MTTSSAADCVPRPNLCVPTSERQERVRYKMSDLVQRLRQRSAKVVVVGQGYVGLPVAMRSVEVGFDVVGFDVSEQRVASLRAGESFVGDVSNETLAAALAAGYKPTADTADLAEFDVAVLSVPTPLRDGAPDLSYIESAGRTLGGHLRAGACVISGKHDLSRHDHRAAWADPGTSLGSRHRRVLPGLLPRTHRSGQRDTHLRQHAQGHQRRRRCLACRG